LLRLTLQQSLEHSRTYFDTKAKIERLFMARGDADRLTQEERRIAYPHLYNKMYEAAFRLMPELSDVFGWTPGAFSKVIDNFRNESKAVVTRLAEKDRPVLPDEIFRTTPIFARHAYAGYMNRAISAGDMAEGILAPLFYELLDDKNYPDLAFGDFVAKPLVKWHLSQKNGNDLVFAPPSPQDVLFLEEALAKRPGAFSGREIASDMIALQLCAPESHPVKKLCSEKLALA